MAFTALYDAKVLHPASLRDLFVRLGLTGLFRARWSEQILDEMVADFVDSRYALHHLPDFWKAVAQAAIRPANVCHPAS
jgi:hypothetical protein